MEQSTEQSTEQRTGTIRWLAPAGLAGAEVAYADNWTELDVMYVEQYALALTPVDDADVCYRRWRYTTGSGAVQLVEPGELYRTVRQRRPASNRMLLLSPAVVEQAARAMGAPGPPRLTAPVTWDPQLCAALPRFHASLGEPASLLAQ